MYQLVLFLHVIVAITLVGLVLIQHGKGADIGAAFGSGASQTVFGSAGSGSFLMKLTGGLAALFFVTSISLSYMASYSAKQAQKLAVPTPIERTVTKKPAPTTPAAPAKKQ
jgi:preprotein translocase subunit SecG